MRKKDDFWSYYNPKTGKEAFDLTMQDWKDGYLHDRSGMVVLYPGHQSQAIAIAYSRARKVEPGFGENPISLEKVKEIITHLNKEGGMHGYTIPIIIETSKKFSINRGIIEDIVYNIELGKSPEEIWLELEQLEKGVQIEHEHKDLYITLKKRLESEGVKMPMSEEEFYTKIALGHKEKDYYDLLMKYVERKPTTDEKIFIEVDGEKPISLSQFIQDNTEGETTYIGLTTINAIRQMNIGEKSEFGGGASETYTIKRVNPMAKKKNKLKSDTIDIFEIGDKVIYIPTGEKTIVDGVWEKDSGKWVAEVKLEGKEEIINVSKLKMVKKNNKLKSATFQDNYEVIRHDTVNGENPEWIAKDKTTGKYVLFTNHFSKEGIMSVNDTLEEMAEIHGLDISHIDKKYKQKGKSKLKQIASKKSIAEQIEEEEKSKAQLDVAESFIENRDAYIALNKKAYGELAIAEIVDYGHKQPFGHLRAIGDNHIFYHSDKLEALLDKHGIHHTILESREELLDYIKKL